MTSEMDKPGLAIKVLERPTGVGPWTMSFRIANQGRGPVQVQAGWMPHIVFRAEEIDLSSRPALGRGETMDVAFEVTYTPRQDANEPSNPFLILRVLWEGAEWRVLVQLSVAGPASSPPAVSIAAVNAQRVGFSKGLP